MCLWFRVRTNICVNFVRWYFLNGTEKQLVVIVINDKKSSTFAKDKGEKISDRVEMDDYHDKGSSVSNNNKKEWKNKLLL